MDGVGTPIIGRPRPLPGHDTPNPTQHPYTLNYEEPANRVGSLIRERSPSARTAVLAVFQDTPKAWATRATVKWWTTSPVSAQRTAARESLARGSAA